MVLAGTCAKSDDPDPDQRAQKSHKDQGHSSQLEGVTGSSAVERDSGVLDNSSVERGQSKTENTSESKAKRPNGDELDRSQDDAVESRHAASFLQRHVAQSWNARSRASSEKRLCSRRDLLSFGFRAFLGEGLSNGLDGAVYVDREQ